MQRHGNSLSDCISMLAVWSAAGQPGCVDGQCGRTLKQASKCIDCFLRPTVAQMLASLSWCFLMTTAQVCAAAAVVSHNLAGQAD
jgi:hypothetical protein